MDKEPKSKGEIRTGKRLTEQLEASDRRSPALEAGEIANRAIEEALTNPEFVSSAAIQAMPDAVMMADTAGNVVYVNKAFEALLGYRAAELVGRSALALPTYRSPEDVERARNTLKEVLEKGSAEHVDIGAVTKTGEEIAISFAASVIRDAQGKPKALIAVMRDIAKRKLAEQALRESEENFRALVENALDVSVIANSDLTVRYVSPSVERMLGYKPEELIGKVAVDFLHPDDVGDIEKEMDDFAGNPGHPVYTEVRFRHKDSSWRMLEAVTNNLTRDPTVNAVVINARDVTERKQAEEALRQREEHFRALIENSLDGVTIISTEGTILYESPSAERIVGYKQDELVGRGVFDFLHPDDVGMVRRAFRSLGSRPAQSVPTGVRFLHKDGSWRIMEGIAHNLSENTAVRGIVVNYRDVTEREQAVRALREREDYFRLLVENSLDDVAVLNVDGTIRYQSPSVERVLGYKAEEHTGKRVHEFIHPDDMPRLREAYAGLIEKPGIPHHLEARARHKDASWRTIEVVARNLMDNPMVGGILVNFRDVTERKLAEEARLKHAAALARAEELQLSRQRIVTAQESVRRDIAHEIHGSLQNRIIILLHRLAELERSALPGELGSELGDLRRRLDDLLDNHVRPISHRLYPSILRRGLVAALQSLADQFEASLAVEMDLDEELVRQERANPRLVVEQVRLAAYRIAEEALTNAVKHGNPSRISIALEWVAGGQLRIMVRDNGRGFDVAGASEGLGILMMQDYAEVAGGNCTIRSTPDVGTEVTAMLPLPAPGAEHLQTALPSE